MRLFGSTKNVIDKTKNGGKVPSLEVVELVLAQCNLVDSQYQQWSEVLYTFTPNKCYTYLLNVKPSNLVFLKTYNTEFDEIIVTFMDQNGRPFGNRGFLKALIEFNVNMDAILKHLKLVELNISIATVFLNKQILQMI